MSPFDNLWFALGVPGGALLFAIGCYLWFAYEGRRLDREQKL